MARRGDIGTVDRLTSGRYRARYQHPFVKRKENGAPNRISAPTTFKTKSEAWAWLRKIDSQIATGTWQSPEDVAQQEQLAARAEEAEKARNSRVFDVALEEWWAQRDIKASTAYSERLKVDRHILPYWKKTPLVTITHQRVLDWVRDTLAPGSPGNRDYAFQLFRQVLQYAKKVGYIDSDPTAEIRIKRLKTGVAFDSPKPRAHNRHKPWALQPVELAGLLHGLPERYRLPVELMAKTGIRTGELRALKPEHVSTDGDRLTLDIYSNVTGQGKTLRIDETPKTKHGIRSVPVPPSLVADIRSAVREATLRGSYLFVGEDPSEPLPQTSLIRAVKRAGERAGLPRPVSPHDLRHTAVSLMIQSRIPPTTIMDIVGHSDSKMVRHYAHTYSEAKRDAIDILDRMTQDNSATPKVSSMDDYKALS